jgi:hypothetical protein
LHQRSGEDVMSSTDRVWELMKKIGIRNSRGFCLPEGIPSFDAYYDARKLWPPASLERRRAIFG